MVCGRLLVVCGRLVIRTISLSYKHKVYKHTETQMLGKINMLLSITPATENFKLNKGN